VAAIQPPRKRRTRQHVIAGQSVNHVERFIIDAGYTALRTEKDYGYNFGIAHPLDFAGKPQRAS
jgi:hypothetical protein